MIMISVRSFGLVARRVMAAASVTPQSGLITSIVRPSVPSLSMWLIHREYSSKGKAGPLKPKVLSRRIQPRSASAVASTPPASAAPAPSAPAGTNVQQQLAANESTQVVAEPSPSSVPPLSTALAPAQGLAAKARAFFTKYKNGLRVLLKKDIPRYRQLKSVPMENLSRRDAVFVERVRHDIKILAPFGVFLIILPEIIPLLVIKGLVPSTCIDRDDRVKAWTKQLAKREVTAAGLWAALSSPRSRVNPNSLLSYESVRSLALRDTSDFQMNLLQHKQHQFMISYFGLSPYFPYPYPLGGRITRHLKDLERDDWRLRTESNSIQELTDNELAMACEVRGIPTVASPSSGAKEPSRGRLERELELWVQMNTDEQIPKALVVFARIVQTAKMVRDHGGNPKI